MFKIIGFRVNQVKCSVNIFNSKLNPKRAYKQNILWALFLSLVFLPAFAKSKIESIYFDGDKNLVFEFENQTKPDFGSFIRNSDSSYSMVISDSSLNKRDVKNLENEFYSVSFEEDKSPSRNIFQANDLVVLTIKSKDANPIKLDKNPLLEGFSYQITIEDIKEDTHYLEVNNASANINEIAYSLKKAIDEDPQNLNAHLGLARIQEDNKEKLEHYLSSISDEALLAIGDAWFIQAQEKGKAKDFAKAMIPFQFVILKDPTNPKHRYRYARMLEDSGSAFFAEASKRYLEAAALAKKLFLSGDKGMQILLRNSTESLIKTLARQGKLDKAAQYCDSYLNLGYKTFVNGTKVLAIVKELNQEKNPFDKGL